MNLPKEIQDAIDKLKISDLSRDRSNLIAQCPTIEDAINFIKSIPVSFIGVPIWINDRPSALIFNVVGESNPKPILKPKELPEF
jgi:hypothetical protein